MKHFLLFGSLFFVWSVLSCKKGENCESTTTKLRFENTTPDDLQVEVSRKGEWNTAFREVELAFFVAANGFSEKEVEAGERYIRWSACTRGGAIRCTEIFLKQRNYQACKSYTEQSKP